MNAFLISPFAAGSYSPPVTTFLGSVDTAGMRNAMGLGTTDSPTLAGLFITAGFISLITGNSTGTLAVSGSVIRFGGGISLGGQDDAPLFRDGPGIIAQRNGTAKQALRVYNTTLSTAPEWAEFDWITSGIGNTLRIGTNLSGTGVARPIEFVVGGVVRWTIATSGNATFTGGLTIGSAAAFSHSGRVLFSAPSVGVYLLQNNTQDDFNRLQLGGTTSSFPAIKRQGAGIDIVLANDSGFAPVRGKLTTDTAFVSGVAAATGYLTLYESNGTAYRVWCTPV